MRYFSPFLSVWSFFAALAGALLLAATAQAQNRAEASYDVQKRLTISTVKLPEARTAVNLFLQRRAAWVQKKEETPEQLVAEFTLPLPALPALDSLAASLGYVLENNLNTQNLTEQLNYLQDAVADARLTLARQETELRQVRSRARPDSAQARVLELRLDQARTTLRRTQRQATALAAHDSLAFVALRVFDEITFPTANRKVTFVNMPGLEYGVLRLENAQPGLSSRFYRGYNLKYLFTRGKSYFNLGVYKPATKNTTDSAFVSELFVLNFGQDFYPRSFGRGKRKFLNLYTSYQVGGVLLNRNGSAGSTFVPNLNLGLGLELLKTKHVLLDTKGSYFLPVHRLSRDLRGLLGQVAFSFVF